jgi:phage terminase large subunit
LIDAKKPWCTEQEFTDYVWSNKKTKEEPVKENDHGMDAVRYAVMHVDGEPEIKVMRLG